MLDKKVKKYFVIYFFKIISKKFIFHATSQLEKNVIKKIYLRNTIVIARDIPYNFQKINTEKSKISLQNTFRIIFSSRVVKNKNLAFLPKILKLIDFDIQFDIYGDVYDLIYFKEIEEELNKLEKNIKWEYRGRLDFNEARIVFKDYNLFIFPTLGENYGFVILESLSCGCPVLLSSNTTPWNSLEENGVGFNLTLDNAKVWANKIIYYKNLSEYERKIISNKCKNYALQMANINEIKNENLLMFKINTNV